MVLLALGMEVMEDKVVMVDQVNLAQLEEMVMMELKLVM